MFTDIFCCASGTLGYVEWINPPRLQHLAI